MRFTVVYLPSAESDLAGVWMHAPNAKAVSAAANAIDQLLATDAHLRGSPHSGPTRILLEKPLGVLFDVSEPDRLAKVWAVWLVP
jgi:plasmid stabilization system protein ParE